MAWRIHDNVRRGEIDNREQGRVRGRLWINGVAEPVTLELEGNACSDLAGCLLTFENPGQTYPVRGHGSFAQEQRGTAGDMTASRKVRVPDVPMKEFMRLRKQGLPTPEHIANCLYLEWFSQANGRVVVESTEYKLTIVPPAWRLSSEQEEQRQHDAAEGFTGFLDKLSQAIEETKVQPPPDKEWDEFDYEKLLRESDARTDKYMELLDKFRDHPERERLVSQEMGWDFEEEEEELDSALGPDWRATSPENEGADLSSADENDVFDLEDDEGDCRDVDETNPICAEDDEDAALQPDPSTEGVDWVRGADGEVRHPLCLRASNSSTALWRTCEELSLRENNDEDLWRLLNEFQVVGAKLAGALNGLAYGRDQREAAFVVACLKRALAHVHAAQAALEQVAQKRLLPPLTVASTRQELFAIREETLRLMVEFRAQP